MTIAEAVKIVLQKSNKPMSIQEIYDSILTNNLYTFGANDPKSALASAIRRNSDSFPKAPKVIFKKVGKGKFELA